MTTATAPAARPPALPFAERVRLHPRAGDLFRAATRFGGAIFFEVEFVSSPWVFYHKWSPDHPVRQNCKVRLGAWRDNLAKAEIEKVNA